MKFEAKAISDGCLCFCFRSYRWIFYGILIIPIYPIYKKSAVAWFCSSRLLIIFNVMPCVWAIAFVQGISRST